jgi:hypothetical protein
MAKWRAEVEGKPEHPRRSEIAAQEHVRAHPELAFKTVLYYSSASAWRTQEEQPFSGVKYNDWAVGDGVLWNLDSRSLALADAAEDSSVERLRECVQVLRLLATQGISILGQVGSEAPIKVDEQGGSWTALVSYPTGGRAEVSGTLDAGGSPLVARIRTFTAGSKAPAATFDALDRRQDPILGRTVTTRGVRAVGVEVLDITLEPGERVEAKEVASVTRPPDPLGVDPIRGKLALTTINDLRAAERRISTRSPAGWAEFRLPDADRSADRLRWIGWAAAGAIVVTLVVIRFRSQASR